MATYSTNEFKNGLKLIIDGDPCSIVENEVVKPGKGQAFNRVRLKNLKTGRTWEKTYKSGENVEAADVMDLGDGEHFLFVSEDTLAMHWLYTFYAPLDAEEKHITGHWRSLDSAWESELNSALLQVNTLVTSPDVKLTPEGWGVASSGEVDFLNGGGEWRVLTRT